MKLNTFVEEYLLPITLIVLAFMLVKDKGMMDKLMVGLSIVVTYLATSYWKKKSDRWHTKPRAESC